MIKTTDKRNITGNTNKYWLRSPYIKYNFSVGVRQCNSTTNYFIDEDHIGIAIICIF